MHLIGTSGHNGACNVPERKSHMFGQQKILARLPQKLKIIQAFGILVLALVGLSAKPALCDTPTPAPPAPVPVPYPNIGGPVTQQTNQSTANTPPGLSSVGAASFGTHSGGAKPQNFGHQFLLNRGTTQLGIGAAFAPQVSLIRAASVSFRWTTNVAGTVGGKWSVSETPLGAATATGVVSGLPGQVSQFQIDFSKFAPRNQPDATKVYFVTIGPVNAQGRGLWLPSNAVKVICQASAR
jgi:hypothetical protein